jgi:hypothetical protein
MFWLKGKKKVAREQYKIKRRKKKEKNKGNACPPSTRDAVSSGAMWKSKKKSFHSL